MNWISSPRPNWIRSARLRCTSSTPAMGWPDYCWKVKRLLTGPEFREKLKKHFSTLTDQADAAALAAELRAAVEAKAAELAKQSPEWYAQIVTRVDGAKVTRQEMLQFVKEHELTHRAQLFMYLRLKGIVPVTTRRRLAMQAKRA